MYTNFGIQLGINLSKINPSFDIGLNTSIIKKIPLKRKNELHLGASLGVLCQKIQEFGNGVQISNNKFLFSSEFLLNYHKQIGRKSCISLGTTYDILSSYNKRSEYESMVLAGERTSSQWHYSVSHLYKFLTAHTFALQFSRSAFAFSVYLREDLLVNNAPDIQTGVAFKFHL